MKYITFEEYMNNPNIRTTVDESLTYKDGLEMFDYLFYDCADDSHHEDEWSYAACNYKSKIKENLNALLEKYDFKDKFLTRAFDKEFHEWKSFYKELDDFFNVFLQKNNIQILFENS